MSLFACSGPGALSAITSNIDFAILQAQIVAGVAALSCVFSLFGARSGWLFPAFICAGLAAHPLWLIDPNRGDCGIALARWAGLLTIFASGIAVVQLSLVFVPRKAEKSEEVGRRAGEAEKGGEGGKSPL